MSYSYDSSSDRLIAGTTAPPATGTFSAWLYANWNKSDGATHCVLETGVNGNNLFNVQKYNDDIFYAGWYTNAEYRVSAAAAAFSWNAAGWNHLLLTWDDDANETKFYINGSQAGSTVSTLVTFSGTTGGFILGNYDTTLSGSANLDGRLAEVAIWSRVLAADERAALYAGHTPDSFPRSGFRYWPLVRDLHDVWGGDTARNVNAAVAEHCRVFLPCGGRLNSKPSPATSPWSGRLAASDSYLVRLPE